jgi:DNA-binding beta-propeller fold protein YncE
MWLVGALSLTLVLLAPVAAAAELLLPPGFTAHVYVTGEGFGTGGAPEIPGLPSASTLAFDPSGVLYLARTGRRYGGGENYDLTRVYRVPAGGARFTRATEARYAYGPPLHNPQVAAIHGRDVLVSTFEHDRKIGVVYRVRDGRAELLAGGTPERGAPPLLTQPEGAAVDAAGNVYVADRGRGVVVKLDPSGRVLDGSYASVRRPRALAVDGENTLWIASDGDADAPWQRGQGEIRKVTGKDAATVVMRGLIAAAIAVTPAGHLFVADRHAGKILFVSRDGTAGEFAGFTNGDAPRGLAFAPITPETRAAGIAGDLFAITIQRGTFALNEVVRISGPFDELVRSREARGDR